MKKFLIGLLAIGSLSAQASMLETNGPLDAHFFEAELSNEKTYFETLGDLFKTGTLPNLSKLSNIAWSGRCFTGEDQNSPTNAGYIFRKKRSDAGPISSTSIKYEASSYWELDRAPNYYDTITYAQILVTKPDFRNADIKINSVEIGFDNNKSNLKMSGSYLVEELTYSEINEDTNGSPSVRKTVFARCYYFIPELNN